MNKNRIKDWAELVRLPNLFTVPGDILLGMCAVSSFTQLNLTSYLYALFISLLLYSGGMILNDIMDYKEDKEARPQRVLPSGRISLKWAKAATVSCFSTAIILSHFHSQKLFIISLVLVLVIYLYDGPSRKIPQMGFVTMGMCRSLNILLGALAISDINFVVILVAFCEGAYIYAVCIIAHNETKCLPKNIWCKLPLIIILISVSYLVFYSDFSWLSISAALFILWSTFNIVKDLNDLLPVSKIPMYIGKLIRNLIPLQFCLALCVAPKYWYLCLVLMLCLPLCAKLAKKVTMS
ncbi:UbiA family prenyltransferase [Lentisphaera profundi]|uniref:UbiA family prenyltransferase n=1 Tax=Lentisphaera profundi TaxID=1658616 RepID=A0ABY7VTH2_9BACT|nr:UbiA family prenyltransferase [Lentisphaera profundi]WDE97470.1 UbiA family prenyltransferase [Lentisphaera profundi]